MLEGRRHDARRRGRDALSPRSHRRIADRPASTSRASWSCARSTGVPIHVNEHEVSWIMERTGIDEAALVTHEDRDQLNVGDVQVTLLHTPGHTPGSQCLLVEGGLLSGDTLFIDGCGRTDFPGGDTRELFISLSERLATVSDDTVLYPGPPLLARRLAADGRRARAQPGAVRGEPRAVARHVFLVSLAARATTSSWSGAGLAGWRLVEFLRREGLRGRDHPHRGRVARSLRPTALSKQVLSGRWDVSKSTLATPEKLVDARAKVMLGDPAVALDVESTTVELASGKKVAGTHVVIATGARARPLSYPSSGELMTLRTFDDFGATERSARPARARERGRDHRRWLHRRRSGDVDQGAWARTDRARGCRAPAHHCPWRRGVGVVALMARARRHRPSHAPEDSRCRDHREGRDDTS